MVHYSDPHELQQTWRSINSSIISLEHWGISVWLLLGHHNAMNHGSRWWFEVLDISCHYLPGIKYLSYMRLCCEIYMCNYVQAASTGNTLTANEILHIQCQGKCCLSCHVQWSASKEEYSQSIHNTLSNMQARRTLAFATCTFHFPAKKYRFWFIFWHVV